MADLDEQRKKVEELKRKILEQKKKGASSEPSISKPIADIKEKVAPVQNQVPEVKQPTKAAIQQQTQKEIGKTENNIFPQQEEEKWHAGIEISAKTQHTVSIVSLQAYAQTLKQAWANGALSKDEETLLSTLRKSMGISDEEHASLEQEAKLDVYLQAIIDSWKNGSITPQDSDRLDVLRERFKISAEEHMRLEKQVRQEILRQH